MSGVVRVKDGVAFTTIAPAGFRILRAIDYTANRLGLDLTITSACDGDHSGPGDPHHAGEAFDLRTHGLTDAKLQDVLHTLGSVLNSEQFFVLHESIGTPNEHIHAQRRRNTVFPPSKGFRA
jgi:hypothetical protein